MIGPRRTDAAPDAITRQLPQAGLSWFADGGEYIVFNDLSGRTSQLDPAASLVFATLAERAMTPGDLCGLLAERWQVATDDLDRDAVSRILDALEESGLVEKAPA